jgi:LacI family transcriptional regulator
MAFYVDLQSRDVVPFPFLLFRRSIMAREKRSRVKRRPHVALLVETSLISGREILRGISRYVQEHGPWAIFHEPRSLGTTAPAWLKTWRGDGIIVRVQTQRIAEVVERTGLPAVDVLGVAPDSHIPLVHVDNAMIAQAAAGHFLERGLRHFGFCGFSEMNWVQQRRSAFEQALTAEGHSCKFFRIPLHTRSDSSWEAQQDRLAAWIQSLPKPVGIMACYDPVGQKVLEACRRAEAIVPDQVAVVGVDNDETVCDVCNPPLSSVMANHARVGYEAAALLDRLMRGAQPPKRACWIQPTGVSVRPSSDIVAVGDEDVAAALRLIHQQACSGLTVRDVVACVSVSHSTLKTRFQRILGRSIRDEMIHTQLKEAQRLLATTDLPLRTVAVKSGFHHQEYLGAVFRARLAKTPGQFRKEAQITAKTTG